MAVYRARWHCPTSGVPKARDFTTKREADDFAKLPRDHFVYVKRENDNGPSRRYERRKYG